jgi:benzoyl-CoA reductase/2-hydroxyglutaryl-CoA dehydratase subunit BcrC/BadD/HgdB
MHSICSLSCSVNDLRIQYEEIFSKKKLSNAVERGGKLRVTLKGQRIILKKISVSEWWKTLH